MGTKLVVAADGSLIVENDVLKLMSKELIMVLENNSFWEADISFSLPTFLESSTITCDQGKYPCYSVNVN